MSEYDVIWMSLVIFLPTAFALGLLVFPRGWEEAMRWWSLVGTAVTLVVSLCMFIQFRYDTIEKQGILSDPQVRDQATARERSTLEYRSAHAAEEPQNPG